MMPGTWWSNFEGVERRWARNRWAVLAVFLPVYTLFLLLVLNAVRLLLLIDRWPPWSTLRELPSEFASDLTSPGWWQRSGTAIAIFVALQILFLMPVWRQPIRADSQGRSLFISTVIAGGIGAVLVVAVALAMTFFLGIMEWAPDLGQHSWYMPALGVLLGVSWVVWGIAIWIFTRAPWPETRLQRTVGILLSGTAIELLCVLPMDIMIRRRTDCYCWSGSYYALYGSVAIGIWLAGPGVVLALLSKRRRTWREQHCGECGYAKGPRPGLRCSECGFRWR